MTSSDMDMSGMDMSSNSTTLPMAMTMLFFSDITTPLYSAAWTPSTTGTYAGTCIFLIVLGVIFRCLIALRAWKEARWFDAELNRRYVVVRGSQNGSGNLALAEALTRDSLAKEATAVLTENGVAENVVVVQKRRDHVRPWRFSVDPLRAVMDTIIAGVGYLLMLAVMTMNVGYFLSVLGGTFVGSMLVGRYAISAEH